jgi:hypothetical protein
VAAVLPSVGPRELFSPNQRNHTSSDALKGSKQSAEY